MLEVVEGGEADAEVVEREAAAEPRQALGEARAPARGWRSPAVSVISKISRLGSIPVASISALDELRQARSSIDLPERLTSRQHVAAGGRWRRSAGSPRATTQRSISWISPKRSAVAEEGAGQDQLAVVADRIRSSSSYWETLAGAQVEDRLAVEDEALVARARRGSRSDQRPARLDLLALAPAEYSATRSRPASLACVHREVGAGERSSPALSCSSPTPRCRCSSSRGSRWPSSDEAARARIASSTASPWRSARRVAARCRGSSTANSSPPSRATTSVSRTRLPSTSADARGSARRRPCGRACR